MDLFERLNLLLLRLAGYLHNEPLVVLVELALFWAITYMVFKFLRGTRGARAIKGAVLVLIVATLIIKILGSGSAFERLNFIDVQGDAATQNHQIFRGRNEDMPRSLA